MTIKYHGEVFIGKTSVAVDSDCGYSFVITVTLTAHGGMATLQIDAEQARDLARHLSAAADTDVQSV